MSVYEPWDEKRGAEIIAEHSDLEGSTLVILHALQQAFGYVPEPAIPMVAEALRLSRAEVHGVAVDELEAGLTAAAAPIRSAHGDIIASMSLRKGSSPKERWPASKPASRAKTTGCTASRS